MQVDFPALERPTNAISGTSSGGRKCNCGAVVKNLAVCNHPSAVRALELCSESIGLEGGVLGIVISSHCRMALFCLPDNLLHCNCTMKLISHVIVAATLVATPLLSFASEEKAAPAAAAPAANKPDLAKGEASFAACAACHGADGNSPAPTFPSLAQQHPEYLIKQLQEFKTDKRANEIMKGMSAALSDEDMKNVSYFVAAKKAAPTAAVSEDKKQLALGKKIYQGGVMERQIPACSGCHSPTGAGIPAQYPRLRGQHTEYTEAQLKAFRDGSRANSTQMTDVAAKLNDREIKAVADYIASLR